jgi:UDP-N-acetylmuramoyl-tripeptide--D-alanyl-D-alanine ligase
MMPLWSTRDLLEATGGEMRAPFDATGVSIDTRTLVSGDLFVALCGETGDGHDFVSQAFSKGAAGAMVHWEMTGRALVVDDTLRGLAGMGRYGRVRFRGRVVAVTGSVGKTTTKEMLRAILSAQAPTHAAVASYNNHWGLPLTFARLPRDFGFCVAEIGMNHPGEIEPLARLACPHVALITSIEKAHIGYLGSIEAIADEKAAILRGLKPGGIAILPADTPQLPRLRAAAAHSQIVTFGSNPTADARLVSLETNAETTTAELNIAGDCVRVCLSAPGRHMALNALAAVTTARALGIPPKAAALAVDGFSPLTGRGARRQIALPGGTALLLDESYNGNGASMRAALSVLRLLPGARHIAVLGDMLELGAEAEAEHLALAEHVAAAADKLYACCPMMQLLYDAVPAPLRGAHAPDSAALANIVAPLIRPGDALLVKGSLGSRMKLIVSALDRLAEPA